MNMLRQLYHETHFVTKLWDKVMISMHGAIVEVGNTLAKDTTKRDNG